MLVAAVVFLRPAAAPDIDGFAALTKEDPLFYTPFFDEEAFSEARAQLLESEERMRTAALTNIESMSDGSQKETYRTIIRTIPLFPHEFLASLNGIPNATDTFLAAPSLEGAQELLAQYARAADAYEAGAVRSLEVLRQIDAHTPAGREHLYFFTSRATSAATVEADFELIHKNALALKDEIARRERCLAGSGSCRAQKPSNEEAKEIRSALMTPGDLGPYADFIRSTLPYHPEPGNVRGPYHVSSACFPGDAQWLYLIFAKKEGARFVLPKLATQNYYRLVAPDAGDRISRAVRSRGLSFYSQTEGTTYECTDLTFYPLLLTADRFARDMQTRGTTVEELLSESAYRRLAENRFTELAPALVALASYTDLLGTSQRIGTDFVLSPQFLFSTRSAYSLTYLPYARSVWRIKENPSYLLSKEAQAQLKAPSPFATLDELIIAGYTEQEVARSHLQQDEFIRSLVQE